MELTWSRSEGNASIECKRWLSNWAGWTVAGGKFDGTWENTQDATTRLSKEGREHQTRDYIRGDVKEKNLTLEMSND